MPDTLYAIYERLRQHFGHLPDWWPIFGDDAPFEMLLGAVLVQQTRWEAVEGAVLRLRDAGLLSPPALARTDAETLAPLLRPVAFYRQKASGLRALSAYLCEHYAAHTTRLLAQPTEPLRRELLALPRIGPETADVILLYIGRHPVFVIDDYTRRLFGRVAPQAMAPEAAPPVWERARYAALQAHIEHDIAAAVPAASAEERQRLYATYHALINEQCVRYCVARRPRCDGPPARRVYSRQEGRDSYLHRHDGCPLRPVCAFYQRQQESQQEAP
jgi:endonuclease-3 related protein